jgi:ferritin-like protein
MASDSYHEQLDLLSEETKNMHRAIVSLMEELEAVDWYQQRANACSDEALTAVLEHNRDEEIEHACMVLEWLRRNVPKFDEEMRNYLFTEVPITQAEDAATGGNEAPSRTRAGSLGIGGLKEDPQS